MRRALLLALALVLALAGCGDGDGNGDAADTSAEPGPPKVEEPDLRSPSQVLLGLVEAAGDGEVEAMWELLSEDTRERFGGSLEAFRSGAAAELQEGLGSYDDPEIVLEEGLGDLAVVTIAGERTAEGMPERSAYAAALWLEGDGWRVTIGGPPEIEPLEPVPGSTVQGNTIVSVRFGTVELDEGTMWIDAAAVPSLDLAGDGVAVGSPSVPLDPGPHVATALAVSMGSASARAWTFEVA